MQTKILACLTALFLVFAPLSASADVPPPDGGEADGGGMETDGGSMETDGGSMETDGGPTETDGGSTGTDGGSTGTDGGSTTEDDGGGCTAVGVGLGGGFALSWGLALAGVALVARRRRR